MLTLALRSNSGDSQSTNSWKGCAAGDFRPATQKHKKPSIQRTHATVSAQRLPVGPDLGKHQRIVNIAFSDASRCGPSACRMPKRPAVQGPLLCLPGLQSRNLDHQSPAALNRPWLAGCFDHHTAGCSSFRRSQHVHTQLTNRLEAGCERRQRLPRCSSPQGYRPALGRQRGGASAAAAQCLHSLLFCLACRAVK